jgi:hypothetical protein
MRPRPDGYSTLALGTRSSRRSARSCTSSNSAINGSATPAPAFGELDSATPYPAPTLTRRPKTVCTAQSAFLACGSTRCLGSDVTVLDPHPSGWVWFSYCDVEPSRGLTAPIVGGAAGPAGTRRRGPIESRTSASSPSTASSRVPAPSTWARTGTCSALLFGGDPT